MHGREVQTGSPPAVVRPLRRNSRFQLLWTAAAVSRLGSQMSALACPLLVLANTGSPAKAGLVSTAGLVGMIVAAVPAGPLVDRMDRRRMLIGCEAVRAAGAGSVAVAVLAGRVSMPHLVAVALLEGAASAWYNPARLAAIRSVVPRPQLRSALAQEEVRTHATALAGPPLGGLLYGAGRAVPFVADAVSYLVALVCLVAARVPRRPGQATTPGSIACPVSLVGQAMEGLRWLWRARFVRAVCGFSLAVNLFTSGMLLPVIVLITDRGGSSVAVGVVVSGMGAGGLVGAAVAARIGGLVAPGRLVPAFGLWLAVLLPGAALPLGPLWPGAALALAMAALPVLNVTVQAGVLTAIPERMLGRITSLIMIASLGFAPLGPILNGFLTAALGPVVTLLLVGTLLGAVSAAAAASPALRGGLSVAPRDAGGTAAPE